MPPSLPARQRSLASPSGRSSPTVAATSRTSLFANAYCDFDLGGSFSPCLGAGVGFTKVDVDDSPSGVGIINGDNTVFAWQLKAAGTYRFNNNWEAYGEYAYRQSEDVSLDNRLFPGTLDIENQQSVFSLGIRYRFS